MKKNYRWKLQVGKKKYVSNDTATINQWYVNAARKGWKCYLYDFLYKEMYIAMNNKEYKRPFGSKKMRVTKDDFGRVLKFN